MKTAFDYEKSDRVLVDEGSGLKTFTRIDLWRKKLSVGELKKIDEYYLCIEKCEESSRELRGGAKCPDDEAREVVEGFRIGVTSLSPRELEVFALIGYGLTTKQIAKHVSVTGPTIETYCDASSPGWRDR